MSCWKTASEQNRKQPISTWASRKRRKLTSAAGRSTTTLFCHGHVPRRFKARQEFDQIRLPQLGVEMAEMAVRVGAGRDQHVMPALDPLHRPLDGAELGRVGVVLGVVD